MAILILLIDHNKHDLDYIVDEVKRELISVSDNIESIIYKLSWHYTIVINMLRRKYPESPLQAFQVCTDKDKLVYDFLKEIDSPSILSMTITDLFLSFVKLVKLKASVSVSDYKADLEISSPQQNTKTFGSILKRTESFIQNHLREVIGGDKLYILIDDLDIDWNPYSQTQQKLMSALFSAVNVYLNEPHIKPIVALRTDIFKGLQVHQREKYGDLILKVEWNEELLRDFLKKRISKVYQDISVSDIDTKFFEGNIDGEDPIKYMIGYTLDRPRDLLELCKLAIKEASSKKANLISEVHIKDALDEYSLNRVIALEDEWKLLHSNLEKLIKLIARFSTHEQISDGYSPVSFHETLNRIRSYLLGVNKSNDSEPMWFLEKYGESESTPQDIVSTLYDLGIIYLVNEGRLSKQASDSRMPRIITTTTIKIHPMFSRYMALMIDEDKSPWLSN